MRLNSWSKTLNPGWGISASREGAKDAKVKTIESFRGLRGFA